MEKNNIFSFATSELSQDAMFCWLINCFNCGNQRLKTMSESIVKSLIEGIQLNGCINEIEKVRVYRQYSEKAYFDEGTGPNNCKELKVKIDVLVVVNDSCAIIIEDKTFSGEHDNQIERYKVGLKRIAEKGLRIEEDEYVSLSDFVTVFWKTGLFYDVDELVRIKKKADMIVDAKKTRQMIEAYRDEDPLIQDYIQRLDSLDAWYSEHEKYWMEDRVSGMLNVEKLAIKCI